MDKFILLFFGLFFSLTIFGQMPEINLASKKGDINKVISLLENGANINSIDGEGKTPLLNAFFNGHDSLGNYLIDRDANLNIESYQGWTILISAVRQDKIDLVRKLINKGADINYLNRKGTSALDAANSEDITKYLLSIGAKTGFQLLNPNPDKKYIIDKKGMKQGYWELKVSKEVIGKGEFKNDKKVGEWKFYLLNGKIDSEGAYRNDNKNGIWKLYFYPIEKPDLQLVNIEKYINDKLDETIKMEW